MTMLAITLPWQRMSPLYMPRRDLVADLYDSLSLVVTLVQSDDPAAPPADLISGPTFPAFSLAIWNVADTCRSWDYGGALYSAGGLLWSGTGTIDATLPGTVDFSLPLGTFVCWPPRCGWGVLVAHDTTMQDTIATGFLHLPGPRPMFGAAAGGGGGGTINSDSMAVWFSTLPTTLPPDAGLPWNDGGVLAFS